MKVNLGCGPQVVAGWVNVDYSPGARFAKIPFFSLINKKLKFFNHNWDKNIFIHNLTKRFPWPDNSVEVIYASHILEHFTRDDGYAVLKECHRVLKQNGIIRIIVPDLLHAVNKYISGKIQAEYFLEELCVLYDNSDNPIKKHLYPFLQFPHKCMYDTKSLTVIMNKLGFSTVSKKAFESEIADISQIELPGRTEGAVVLEGKKS